MRARLICKGRIASRCVTVVVGILTILIAGTGSADDNLPDIGSPSDAILSRNLEAQIGRQIYFSLIESGKVITDPELQEYIQDIGMRLAANAKTDGQRYQFFIVNDPVINAFALPGGYIGVHTGLILATKNESELAGVLAHEISHVTQRHISRAVFANQRASTLSMASMLGAILIGVATGADPGLIQGAVGAAQGVSMEQQISFTRSNEMEADSIGLDLLAAAGFDATGMPNFFETMGRSTATLSENKAPEFLLTHPVSTDRMAETRARAAAYPKIDAVDSSGYAMSRARSRLLTSSRPELVLDYYRDESTKADKVGTLEVEYGIALANAAMGNSKAANESFSRLLADNEEVVAFHSGKAIAQMNAGEQQEALATFREAIELFPGNVALTVRYAETLMQVGKAKEAHTILLELLNKVPPTLEQVRLIALAANAAGDTADSYYYMAEYHAMSGSLRLALEQLRLALSTPGLDNVERARYTARMEQFQGYLLAAEAEE
jgi:beta-barrel assembly-enhancing protease